jgi:hypothetical protein
MGNIGHTLYFLAKLETLSGTLKKATLSKPNKQETGSGLHKKPLRIVPCRGSIEKS